MTMVEEVRVSELLLQYGSQLGACSILMRPAPWEKQPEPDGQPL